MKYKNGDEELYDMKTDSGQFTNLAEKKEHQATKVRLLTLLKERIKSASLR
jgi:hypothetical protein